MNSVYRITGKCAGCGGCRSVCPAKCIVGTGRPLKIDSERCSGCGLCAVTCPLRAIESIGTEE